MVDFLIETFGEIILVTVVGTLVALFTLGFRRKDESKEDHILKNSYWLGLVGLLVLVIIVGMCSS